MDRAKKWFYDFSAAKTQVVLLDRSKNNDSIDVNLGYVNLGWICSGEKIVF